ncbi:LamG-like jellyroll fold domain-containing protein [Aeoliella sp.]|uniref:LamG-like jellyroll fold domain-containing protein n=1 Tax=Aeoliella sp. TaxID=2795800 RepID=UPI003CCBEEC1
MTRLLGTLLTLHFSLHLAAVSQAALIAHYTFDTDGTASVGADATLGAAASIDNTDFAVGTGALALSGAPTSDTPGADGAVSGDVFDWSTSDTRTVAFWMKASAGDVGDSGSTMISLGSGTSAGNRFDVRLSGDALRLEVQAGGTTTSNVVADGHWHHIALVVTDPATVSNVEYYIDGVSQGTFGGSGTAIATGVGPLRIGDSYQDVSRDFKGLVDDVRLYDTALNSEQIGTLIPEPNAIALIGLACGVAGLVRRKK